jgi:hypothetical protein
MQSTTFEKAWAFITIMVDALKQRRRNKRHGQFELEAPAASGRPPKAGIDNSPRSRTLGTERAAVRQRFQADSEISGAIESDHQRSLRRGWGAGKAGAVPGHPIRRY